MIGDKGVTDSVLQEIDRSLLAHELMKVRVSMEDRDEREQAFAAICTSLSALSVQTIGNILVVYRANPDKVAKPASATPAPRRKKKEPRQTKKMFQDR